MNEELTQALLGLLVTLLGIAGAWARTAFQDWAARQRLNSALGRAAGIALQSPQVRQAGEAALDFGVDMATHYLRSAIPDTLKKLGVPDERLTAMVIGEIGKLKGGRT